MNIRQLLERSDRPFASHPQVGRFYASASMEDARRRLGRTIERGDGLGVVIGPAGTGKSLLLQALAAQYYDQFDVVLLACAQLCTRRALLQAILFELGQEYRLRDEGELRLSLLDLLLSHERDSTGLLLLVDEAQLLPARLLEELRMLTNVVQHGVPRVRLVLAGMPALEEVLAGPELESFSQRVVARSYLAPFTRDESMQYGRAQIAASGGEPDRLFDGDAWHAVFEATDGVPRLVNQLCTRAMWLAEADNSVPISRAMIQAAWSDLQQLPTPWEADVTTSEKSSSAAVVEFGGLHDEPGEPGSANFDAAEEAEGDSWEDLAAASGWSAEPEQTPAGSSASFAWSSKEEDEKAADDWQSYKEDDQSFERSAAHEHESRAEYVSESGETVDPFDEPFDEEEIVLDCFATWDSANFRRSPRVENRRDRGFSTLVQQALDVSTAKSGEAKREATSSAAATAGDQSMLEESKSLRSRVRLAVVSEPAPLRPIPVVSTPDGVASRASHSDKPAAEAAARGKVATSNAAAPTEEVDILIVEDDAEESADLENFGQSDKFRRLLARLRGSE